MIQHHETVKVWFLFRQITGSRSSVLIVTLAIGCVTDRLVGIQQKKSGSKTIVESASRPLSTTRIAGEAAWFQG
ncbi:hypothetical protein [Desulfosarcina sp.]|uniref:hypothetical protein n=1 Tax=Desulfosarcina sp. TaxID=2027861 RepID=UPI0029AEBE39|nr:hypothetical protein [Desulfosarcina sp.]MDX2454590.1 hypothetical protein [Desulfosarcina sp.]MDX2492214.1 hypothetical protein [Desulfosarcina sp.]